MTSAANLYHSVINDVISSVRDSFLDDQVDENVLQELKTVWERKLTASKTIEQPSRAQEAALDSRMAGAARGRTAGAGGGAVASNVPATSGDLRQGAVGGQQQHLVITDPSRLVPVSITVPAQSGQPSSVQRGLTVFVPAHSLDPSGPTSAVLQQVLTQAVTQALNLQEEHATQYLQEQINNAFKIDTN